MTMREGEEDLDLVHLHLLGEIDDLAQEVQIETDGGGIDLLTVAEDAGHEHHHLLNEKR